jgi:glycosyltransferase involved in cell wall biosynthesis
MNIALVTETFPPEINGVSMTLERLVAGLARRGHAVSVIRPRRPDLVPRGDSRELAVPGLPLPRYPELRFGLPAPRRLRREWTERRPDVVHVATEGPLGFSAIGAARRLGIPVISSFHTNFHSYGDHYGYGLLERVALGYLRAVHNRTQRTFVPTAAVRDALSAAGFRNVDVLGRGVDTERFAPGHRDTALRASWGVAEATPVALHVGRLAPEKNIPVVAASYEAMRDVRPDVKLVLVGDGPARGQLERRYPDAVFAGMRTGADLARHYASGDVFLFPSITETFGNVVTEALASGLAVLAYDYAAAGQHIRSGVDGVTVPFDDSAAFIAAARGLIECRERWPALREAARTTACGLSWDYVVGRFEGALAAAAGLAAPPLHAAGPLGAVAAHARPAKGAP